jgi:hypothetical protein
VSYDIDGATESFYALTLENYPGENIVEFALPIDTGSQLLIKVSKTSCEEFNQIFLRF